MKGKSYDSIKQYISEYKSILNEFNEIFIQNRPDVYIWTPFFKLYKSSDLTKRPIHFHWDR